MARKRGCKCYQSIGLWILNISADFKNFFKGPWPFKQQKTFLSGQTTLRGASHNQGASGVKNWIAVCSLYKSCLSWRATVRSSLYCGIARSGVHLKKYLSITFLSPIPRFWNASVGIAGINSRAVCNTFLSHERRCTLFRYFCVCFLKTDDFMRRRAGILVIAA